MQVNLNWTDFKAFVDARSLSVQWFSVNGTYQLAAVDGAIETNCQISITDPAGPDQTDFETNYKASGNTHPVAGISPSRTVTGTMLSGHETIIMPCDGLSSILVSLRAGAGACPGSVFFYGSEDGINYTQWSGTDVGPIGFDGQILVSTSGTYWLTQDGTDFIAFNVNGLKSFKVGATGVPFTRALTVTISGSQGTAYLNGIAATTFTNVQNFPATQTVTDASIVVQGSTTSGQSGSLVQGAVTTSAPTYTTAKTNPLSLDSSGNLRVSLKDSPANTNKFLVTVDPITFASPQHTIIDSGTVSTITNVVHIDDNGGSLTVDNNGTFAIQAANLELAQASTTSGQVGPLAQTATTTNAPTYVTAKTNPISSDTSGNIRVSLKDSPANTNKFLVTADAITFASPQHVINDAGSALIGKVGIDQTTPGTTNLVALAANQSVNNAQISGTAMSVNNGTADAGTQRVTIASDNTAFSVNATPPTLTKGTQGATGYSIQNLHDAGRTQIRYYAVAAAAGTTTTETAISLTRSSGTSATSAAVSWVITNGKTFRITNIWVATRGHATATIQTTTFNLRINTGGAVTTSSTPIILAMRSATPATASAWDRAALSLPEGLEIVGNGTLQFGITAAATYVTNAPTWDVIIEGYEY